MLCEFGNGDAETGESFGGWTSLPMMVQNAAAGEQNYSFTPPMVRPLTKYF